MTSPDSETTRRRTQRVALVGAHGVGKTTLLRSLHSRLEAMGIATVFVTEVAREVCRVAGDPEFFRRRNNTLERQLMLLTAQPVLDATALAAAPAVLLSDRSLLDHVAYTVELFGPQIEQLGLTSVLDWLTHASLRVYDAILFIPIEFAPVDDGTREGDVAFQLAIDKQIRRLLSLHNIPFDEISGSPGSRVDKAVAALALRCVI